MVAFDLFKAQKRITIEATGVIHICNWEKYQSEYQQKRQRVKYKNSTKCLSNVHTKSSVEGEVEVEEEVEVEAEAAAVAFKAFHSEPYGPQKFRNIFCQEFGLHEQGSWSDMMERVIVRTKKSGIKVPGRFFAHKREIEKMEAQGAYRSTPK